jgi:protein-tyrosine kinase
MERIQRALEISRLQRSGGAEVLPVTPPVSRAARPRRRAPAHEKIETVTETVEAVQARSAEAPAEPAEIAAPPVAATLVIPARSHAPPIPPTPSSPPPPLARCTIQTAGLRRRRVLFADDPCAAARAYRMLRAQLLQRARSSGTRVFGIVSAVSGEGKTITAINLALSLAAEPNQNVALIDFDLRHPSIARMLGMAVKCGLDTWLRGDDAPITRVLYEIETVPRLLVAPALAPVSSSSECLAGPRARQLLEELKADDDRCLVILDLPPALLSDDVITVAPLLDGFILVVTEGMTRREDVERVFELIGRDRLVGSVLNNSADSEQRAY